MLKPSTVEIPVVPPIFLVLVFFILSIMILQAQAQSSDAAAATVNGRKITQQEIDSAILAQLWPLQQQIYALRKAALENYILRVLLEAEAEKRGVSVNELKKQLTMSNIEIPAGRVEQAYLENASAFAQMSPDEAKERLRLDLETQARMLNYRAAVMRMKANARVETHLQEPLSPFASLNENASSIGNKEVKATVIGFVDYQCAFCKESHSAVKQLMQSYGNDVRFVFKHLPLRIHSQSFPAAQAAFCAGEQGKFWQYHEALFASEDFSSETLDKLAVGLNLDILKFKSCLKSDNSRNAVLRDTQEARKLGIDGTPAFIINGKLFRGALSFEDFKTIIESELKSTQKKQDKF